MSEEQINTDNPEADNETSPYDAILKGELTHEQDLERTIRDRGRGFVALFLVLLGSVYGNLYQLRLPKNVPYIHNVDSHGEVVTRVLLRPDEIPPDDPDRQLFIRAYLEKWVTNARQRSKDLPLTIRGINTALRMSAGPIQVKLSTGIREENVESRITHETVEVRMPKLAVWIPGTSSWQAEWEEIVTTTSNIELRREIWAGTFQIAEQPNWIAEKNPYGIHVVNGTWAVRPKGE